MDDDVHAVFGEQQETEDNLEMVARNPQLYFCVLVAWLLTFLMLVYHLRAGAHTGKEYMPIGEKVAWILVALAALVYVVQRHRHQPFRLSASDVIKLLCVLVIFVCTLYHNSAQSVRKDPG